MRLAVPVTLALLTSASLALGQSQVGDSAPPAPENATAHDPLPGPNNRAAPSRPDPKATHDVAPATAVAPTLLRPGAPYVDPLTHHWLLGASASYGTLLGNFSSKIPIGTRLGGAYLFGLDAGYGLTSHWELGLAGDIAWSTAGSSCPNCEALSFGIGPRLRYHLVGGTRFSPWVAYGCAFRQTAFDYPADSATFNAIEPLRIELGGNWYASTNLAIGPVLATGVSRSVTTDDLGDGLWQVMLSAGLRIVLDPRGR